MHALTGQNLYFTHYTTKEGLNQNSVYSAVETKEGFMWFGTQNGLNRFDGLRFEQMNYLVVNDSVGLSKMLTAMYVDEEDNFWIGSTSDLFIYDRFTNKVINPQTKYPGLEMSTDWVNNITVDTDHILWVRDRQSLYGYDLEHKKKVPILYKDLEQECIGLTKDAIHKRMFFASKNIIYKWQGGEFLILDDKFFKEKGLDLISFIYVNNQFWCITSDKKVWIAELSEELQWSTFESIYKTKCLIDPYLLHSSNDSTIWVGSRSDGVAVVDLTTSFVKKSSNYRHQNALRNKFILSFYTNKQGITWVGSSGLGASKFDKAITRFDLFRNDALPGEIQQDNMIFSIFSDNGEDFYCGTLTGGLLHWNIRENTSEYLPLPLNPKVNTEVNNIYTITRAGDGKLYMATWGGLAAYDEKTKKFIIYNDYDGRTSRLATLLYLDKEQKLLVGGYDLYLRYFDLKTKKWAPILDKESWIETDKIRPRSMHRLNDDEVLICSENKCVSKYNMKTGLFREYPAFKRISGMSPNLLITDQYWWIGSTRGLLQVDAKTEKLIKLWNVEAGLSDEVIYSVLEDQTGNIWVGTNNGLNAIEPQTGIVRKYDENDGLQSLEFNTASCFKDSVGNLYFGGVNGFNRIPIDFIKTSPYNPKPLLIKMQVMNNFLPTDTFIGYTKSISLSHTQNFISFEFQSPNFSKTENIVYRYRLLPLQEVWQSNGSRNFVNFTQLSPGNYTFEMQSSKEEMQWSESTSFLVTIRNPWYGSWWFLGFVFLSFFLILAYLYKQRILNIKNKAQMKQRIYETEMAAMKAQMNPHFIFNCINSIDSFIQTNDKYNASIYLNKFAKLIRNILDSSKLNLVPFSKDIETMKLYTELEMMRHENKFQTYFDIQQGLFDEEITIPPLIVQPYVENAIIHGLRNKASDDGQLIIKVYRSQEKLYYEIDDNGIGRAAAAKINRNKEMSYGMQLSKDRVQLFNDNDHENVIITDKIENGKSIGTSIMVILNIENQ